MCTFGKLYLTPEFITQKIRIPKTEILQNSGIDNIIRE